MTPLFNTLGFAFALPIALVAAVAALDLGAAEIRLQQATVMPILLRAASPLAALGRAVWVTTRRVWLLLAVPLGMVLLNAFRVKTCDLGHGLWYFFWLPMVGAALCAGLGVCAGAIAGRRRKLSLLLPYGIAVALVAWQTFRFYAAPPAFFYNILIGYFPGNLYDEQIALLPAFYWSRLVQALLVGGLVVLCAMMCDVKSLSVALSRPMTAARKREAMSGGALLFVAAILLGKSSALGIAHDASDLSRRLGGTFESPHFVIHYPLHSDVDDDIDLIADDHEFRLAQVVRDLGAAPAGKLTSFYFLDSEEKFQAMGARNVHMAKPWRNEIYLNHQPFPHGTVHHEIAHVVAGAFGASLFKISAKSFLGIPIIVNVGMVEGIAVAAAWPIDRGDLTPHEAVKAMVVMGFAPPLAALLSTGFFAFSGAQSYTMSGSFVRFLLDRYGPAPLRAAYENGGDFAAAYGKPAALLAAEWQAFIESIFLPAREAERVRERFRQKSIFKRPCAHAVARWRDEAGEALEAREPERALELLQTLCDEVPGEPTFILDRAHVFVLADQPEKAEPLYQAVASDGEYSSTVRANAFLALAQLWAANDDWVKARAALDHGLALPLSDDEQRNILIHRQVASLETAAGVALRKMLFDVKNTEPFFRLGYAALAVSEEPGSGLAHYLLGRYLSGGKTADASTRALARALALGLSDPLVVQECARLLAIESYKSGNLLETERAAAILLASPRETTRELGADWLERVYWKRTGKVPAVPYYKNRS